MLSKRTFGRVLEAAVHHSAKDLGFEDKIAEVGRVNAHIVPPALRKRDLIGIRCNEGGKKSEVRTVASSQKPSNRSSTGSSVRRPEITQLTSC